MKRSDLYCKENLVDIQGFIWVYPNGASYLHMKHAHDMQNADTEYPFCWLEARHSSWLLAFFAIKLIHELSCIYQTYIIHNISKALDLQIKYTEIDLFFSIYPIRCIRMQGAQSGSVFFTVLCNRYCDVWGFTKFLLQCFQAKEYFFSFAILQETWQTSFETL